MGTTGYRVTYRAALDQANNDLRGLFEEFERLELRKEQLEDVLTALEPFLKADEAHSHEVPHTEQAPNVIARVEPARHIPEPVMTMATTPALEVTPSFSSASEEEMDPIQRRINHALGLAVA